MAATDPYCITIDGSGSYSPSYPTSRLTYLWTDAFGGIGTFSTYTFRVTPAQLAGATSTIVTLNVADPSGLNKTVQIVVPIP